MLRVFDSIRQELESSELPADVEAAKLALESHVQAKRRIAKAPVEQLEQEGQQVSHTSLPHQSLLAVWGLLLSTRRGC